MTETEMTTLQWTDILHINKVEDISAEDRACLAEIRDVLARHGRLHRFGVALLHYHFPLKDNEILVEHCDAPNRTLIVRTMTESEVDRANLIETIWRFDGPKGKECKKVCPKDPDNPHQHQGYAEHATPSQPSTPPTTPTTPTVPPKP